MSAFPELHGFAAHTLPAGQSEDRNLVFPVPADARLAQLHLVLGVGNMGRDVRWHL